MKKMYYLFATLVMCAMSLIVTGCGEDNDEPQQDYEKLIAGTWKQTSNVGYGYTYVKFNSDNTIEWIGDENDPDYRQYGEYKFIGGLLYMKDSDPRWGIFRIVLLNEMTLSYVELDEDGVTLDPYSPTISHIRVE